MEGDSGEEDRLLLIVFVILYYSLASFHKKTNPFNILPQTTYLLFGLVCTDLYTRGVEELGILLNLDTFHKMRGTD